MLAGTPLPSGKRQPVGDGGVTMATRDADTRDHAQADSSSGRSRPEPPAANYF